MLEKDVSQSSENAVVGFDSVLKIKGSDGKYSLVCSDKWKQVHSDIVCKKLGFTKAISWSQIHLSQTDNRYYKINADNLSSNFIANFNLGSRCDEGIISLECQTYCKSCLVDITKLQFFINLLTSFFFHMVACGNKATTGIRIADGTKASDNEWPTLALAVSENATVRCTSTIGDFF